MHEVKVCAASCVVIRVAIIIILIACQPFLFKSVSN